MPDEAAHSGLIGGIPPTARDSGKYDGEMPKLVEHFAAVTFS